MQQLSSCIEPSKWIPLPKGSDAIRSIRPFTKATDALCLFLSWIQWASINLISFCWSRLNSLPESRSVGRFERVGPGGARSLSLSRPQHLRYRIQVIASAGLSSASLAACLPYLSLALHSTTRQARTLGGRKSSTYLLLPMVEPAGIRYEKKEFRQCADWKFPAYSKHIASALVL